MSKTQLPARTAAEVRIDGDVWGKVRVRPGTSVYVAGDLHGEIDAKTPRSRLKRGLFAGASVAAIGSLVLAALQAFHLL
jgi:hypothetical protein